MKALFTLAFMFGSPLLGEMLPKAMTCGLSDSYIKLRFDKNNKGYADFWEWQYVKKLPLPTHLFGPIEVDWKANGARFFVSGTNFQFLIKKSPFADYAGIVEEVPDEVSESFPSDFLLSCK